MFIEGQLLRFDPFIFKNGNTSKPKFFIVLKHMGADLMMASDRFAFPLRTYVYGEQVDEYTQSYLDSMGSNVEDLGIMNLESLNALRICLKQSPLIKIKYSKLL